MTYLISKMESKQFKSYAPFGVQTRRFANIGFHPELDAQGFYKKSCNDLGPGSYNPKYPKCTSKNGIRYLT